MIIRCMIFIAVACSTISCGDNGMMDDSDMDPTQEVEVVQPCLENDVITLPAALIETSNYTQYTQTAQIWSIAQLANQFRANLSQLLIPPQSAVRYEADGIVVFGDDEALTWQIGNEEYIYVRSGDGYKVYFRERGSVSGREIIDLEQSADCSSMLYTQYAGLPGDPVDEGILFTYSFRDIGDGAVRVAFADNLYDDSSEQYVMRQYADGSGDLSITYDETVENMNWNSAGDGCFALFENSVEIEADCWTF